MSYSVLLVEDDPLIGQGLELGLRSRGFGLTWLVKGASVPSLLREKAFDVLVLDLGLPDVDGMDLLQQIRHQANNIPIIVLTARDSVKNRIAGLDHGADDYVTKPTSTDELAARIRAVARRHSGRSSEIVRVGTVELNSLSRELQQDGRVVPLTPIEYLLMEMLMQKKGMVVSVETFLHILADANHDTSPQAIQVHIHSLRKKLGAALISTVRGVGYRLG